MLPRSPDSAGPHLAGLAAILLEEEDARAARELLALDREARGRDTLAIRRGLRDTRPLMGRLRLLRLQLLAEHWRTGARLGG